MTRGDWGYCCPHFLHGASHTFLDVRTYYSEPASYADADSASTVHAMYQGVNTGRAVWTRDGFVRHVDG